MILDPLYLVLIAPAMLFAAYAQARVHGAFNRFSRVPSRRGLTGAEAARAVLDRAGIQGVRIEETHGWLSDHYDPRSRTLRLSPKVAHETSLAAVGVAAHEAGHAIQHAHKYAPLHLRSALVPVAGIGSWLSWPMIMLGLAIGSLNMVLFGVLLFGTIVAFQIVTLPVEFDASSRAKAALSESGILVTQEERDGVSSVLSAAALTYVAATVTAVMQLLYFLLRSGLLGGQRQE